jgi:hypothetical protein
MSKRAVKILEDGLVSKTQSKPQIIINTLLDEMNIGYINEKGFDFYAVDNVGNVGKIGTIKKELLTVHAEVAPYDTPDFSGVPTLEKGQKAVLKIYTTGYADTLAITFPQELVDKDSSLNKTLQITPQAHAETDVVFNVPRNIDEKKYTVNIKAVNNVNGCSANCSADFIVNDDILNGFRTCTIDDNP